MLQTTSVLLYFNLKSPNGDLTIIGIYWPPHREDGGKSFYLPVLFILVFDFILPIYRICIHNPYTPSMGCNNYHIIAGMDCQVVDGGCVVSVTLCESFVNHCVSS